jgi:hypothetical protein
MPGTSSLPGQSKKLHSSQPELNDNWTKVSYKKAAQHKKELKEKPNMTKKVNNGSTKLPLTTATQPY